MNYKRTLLSLSFCALASLAANAQQDAMFTKYMFNTLVFNPAYAGSYDHLSVNLLYRNQWTGIEGAPETQTLTVHSPVSDRVGLGLSMINDVIGPTGGTQANAVYAYRIPVGEKGTLSLALQAGVIYRWQRWNRLNFKDQGDQSYADVNGNVFRPNFGAGAYYYSDRYFVGFSSPRMVPVKMDASEGSEARYARHYYLFGGMALPLQGQDLVFRPTMLIKRVGLNFRPEAGDLASPTQLDIDAAFVFRQLLWLGVAYRTGLDKLGDYGASVESADVWASVWLRNGLRVGAAYDYTLSKLRSVAGGTFEIMLGYDFQYNKDRIVTPRYF